MPTLDNSPIIDRIKKMLALAKQDNVNEAATAAAMAQRLMTRYAINEAMLREEEPGNQPETFERREVYKTGGPLPTWVLSLAGNISSINHCYQTHRASRYGSYIALHGPSDALDLCETMLTWLVLEVERITDEDRAKHKIKGRGNGKSFWTAFRNGAAATIGHRLHESDQVERITMRDEATTVTSNGGATYALARLETATDDLDKRPNRAESWAKEELGLKVRTGRSRYTRGGAGFNAGQAAGHRASLTAAKGRLSG